MIINIENATKFIANDKQRQIVYSMDNSLECLINDAYYPKLYKELPKDASLFELGQNIADEFGLNKNIIKQCDKRKNCYYMGYIYLSSNTVNLNCLETLIHEFAHLFCDYFFRSENQHSHDGHFMAVFRWLLNYYDILSIEQFNYLIEHDYPSIDVYDNFIHTFEYLDKQTFDFKLNESKKFETQRSHTMWTNFNSFKREQVITENFIEYFIENIQSNQLIYIKVKRTESEKNLFFNMDIDMIKKTVLISPTYLMDTDGERITNKHYFPAYLGFCDVCGSDIENNYGVNKSPVQYTKDTSANGRKEINKMITSYSKDLKKKGFNVIKTKSEKEFSKIYWEMKDACRELKNKEI